MVVNYDPDTVVRAVHKEPGEVIVYGLVRVMCRSVRDAVNEAVRAEGGRRTRLPRVPRSVVRNLDRTDVCPSHRAEVRLHLCKGWHVNAKIA